MNVVSLCSGVGLIDLGLEWAGMRTVQLCEINEFEQKILTERFPGVPIHPDAWTITPKECDVIAAGFPCQPFSVAGKQLGDADPRHLWPAIIRSIRLARPRYVILENVPGLVAWGLGEVLGDLAGAGFDAEWTCFNASDVGALHKRRRWWCVGTCDANQSASWDAAGGFFREDWGTEALAYADSGGQERWAGEQRQGRRNEPTDSGSHLADTAGERLQGRIEPEATWEAYGFVAGGSQQDGWWATERGLDRVAHGRPHRMDRLRCLGNGVVPQCAELIGLRLRQLDEVTP